MKMDILAILMVAFCLFAILMFILFYIYAKKSHNERHISEDYHSFDDESDEMEDVQEEMELVDIEINDKDYVFDANGYVLHENDEVNVSIKGNVFEGKVTKGNYKDNIDNYTQVPMRLILQEKEDIIDVRETTDNNEDNDFIPKKKN